MFLHIGENNLVKSKDIIGIFDINSLKISDENKAFIDKFGDDIKEKKTLIITERGNYLSNILVSTMAKRLNKNIKNTQ